MELDFEYLEWHDFRCKFKKNSDHLEFTRVILKIISICIYAVFCVVLIMFFVGGLYVWKDLYDLSMRHFIWIIGLSGLTTVYGALTFLAVDVVIVFKLLWIHSIECVLDNDKEVLSKIYVYLQFMMPLLMPFSFFWYILYSVHHIQMVLLQKGRDMTCSLIINSLGYQWIWFAKIHLS